MELTPPAQLFATPSAAPTTMRSSDANHNNSVASDQFFVEEFFDFSNEDDADDDLLVFSATTNVNEFQSFKADSASSVGLLVDAISCNSPVCDFGSSNLTSQLCVPYDDLAELEWVSTFAEDSFSSEDMEKLQFVSGMSARPDIESVSITNDAQPDPRRFVPGKARSKRPRTAPRNWASRLLFVSMTDDSDDKLVKKPKAVLSMRECLHCQTDNTPQWRTGPLGPKTLCNACGVRYKSGRLVPEYRPASSPTFVETKHSNSHRKVLELRRNNEMAIGTHQHDQRYLERFRAMDFDRSDGEDYLIHRPGFGELIQ